MESREEEKVLHPLLPPPLPVLSGRDAAPTSAPFWAMARDTFPLDASVYKPLPVGYIVLRSPMRRGTLHLSAEGVRAEGRGQPDRNVLATVGSACIVLFFGVGFLLQPLKLGVMAGLAVRVAFLLVGIACSLIGEYRTTPRDDSFPWECVREVWFDKGFRRAAVIYATEDAKGRVRHWAIPLQFRDRSLCGALRDAVERFAPGKSRVGGVAYEWTPRRIALAVALCLALMGFLLLMQHLFPDSK